MTWNWVPDEGQEDMFRRYMVDVYYAATEEDTPVSLGARGTTRDFISFEEWADYATREGYYFFTVTAVSTSQDLIPNSKPSAMSEGLCFEPAPSLPMPSNVQCNGAVVTWDADLTEDQAEYIEYEILVFKEGQTYDVGSCWSGTKSCVIPGDLFARHGPGEYTFSVRAVSWDPAKYSSSYSVRASGSFVYDPGEAPAEVTAQAENGTLTVTVDLETSLPVQAFCTVYDQDGRLLDTRILDLREIGWEGYVTPEGTQTITLDCGEDAYTVKLFLLSPGDYVPVYEPEDIQVN